MDWLDETEELEFEEVTCNCNLRNNKRFLRKWLLVYSLILVIGSCLIPLHSLLAGILICIGTVVFIMGAIGYISYSKRNHSITLVLTRDSLTYTDEMGESKTYALEQLQTIRKKRVFGWGMCYEVCFDDQLVRIYDGDDLSGLLMGLRTLGNQLK